MSEDNSGKGNIFPTRQQAYVKPGGTVEGLGGGAGAAPRGGGGFGLSLMGRGGEGVLLALPCWLRTSAGDRLAFLPCAADVLS